MFEAIGVVFFIAVAVVLLLVYGLYISGILAVIAWIIFAVACISALYFIIIGIQDLDIGFLCFSLIVSAVGLPLLFFIARFLSNF